MTKPTTPIVIGEVDARKLFERLDQDHQNFETLFGTMSRFEDSLKRIERRQDVHQKALDIFDAERHILEDLIVLTRSVQELLKQHKGHQEIVNKGVKADIKEVKDATEGIPNEVRQAVTGKLEQLIQTVEKRKNLPLAFAKSNPIKRIFKTLKFW